MKIAITLLQLSEFVDPDNHQFKILQQNIKKYGQQFSIKVKRIGDAIEIVDGNKRVAALILLNETHVECEFVP